MEEGTMTERELGNRTTANQHEKGLKKREKKIRTGKHPPETCYYVNQHCIYIDQRQLAVT